PGMASAQKERGVRVAVDGRRRGRSRSDALPERASALRATAALVVAGDGAVRQGFVSLFCEGGVQLLPEGSEDPGGGEHQLRADLQFRCGIIDVLPHTEFGDETRPDAGWHLRFRVRDQLLGVVNGVAHRFPLRVRTRPPKRAPQASYAVSPCCQLSET